MNHEQRQQAIYLAENTPRSLLSYWPFAVCLIFLVFGTLFHLALVTWMRTRIPDVEILLQIRGETRPFLESEHVQRWVGATGLFAIYTIALLLLLSIRDFRARRLLREAVIDLDLYPAPNKTVEDREGVAGGRGVV